MRKELRMLRDMMMARVVRRMNSRFGRTVTDLRADPEDYPRLDESKAMWERQLAQMLACALLDPGSLLPVDSKTLHERVSMGARHLLCTMHSHESADGFVGDCLVLMHTISLPDGGDAAKKEIRHDV